MTKTSIRQIIRDNKENLTLRFTAAAFLAVMLSACMMTMASYYYLRSIGLHTHMQAIATQLSRDVEGQIQYGLFAQENTLRDDHLKQVQARYNILQMSLFDSQQQLLWKNQLVGQLDARERSLFQTFVQDSQSTALVNDSLEFSFVQMEKIWHGYVEPMTALTPLLDDQSNFLGALKTQHNFSSVLGQTRATSGRLFVLILGGHLLLVLVLYLIFRRGIRTIDKQETELSEQISRLSNLLSLNKSMQKNIKSASSRAVELNEQFLRRVGADLHDGPAQSIGYAVLRLNQISGREESNQFGHEFHVIKEALDSALEEIRGISTGLVLPELDELTLEQSLNRVSSRHEASNGTKINQFYQDLPKLIPTPIKICAYRFVQEGLNNATRHGQAEKCRVSAHVKDDVLHLSLKDNGMGFRKSRLNTDHEHLGLKGLKDRIESLGGKFNINSELGVGTAIKLSIALTDED